MDNKKLPPNQKADYAVASEVINEIRQNETHCLEDAIAKAYALDRVLNTRLSMRAEERLMARLLMDLDNHKGIKTDIQLREIESKGFDNTTNIKDNFD